MNPSPPHQYPQAIQLKLYQAFIFSIPILFSIILFLLFYLFYLKRRASSSSSSPTRPASAVATSTASESCDFDLKNEVKNKLCEILFDDCTEAKDSLCCVCLGEFEVKEELLQVRACKHMFHVDCIRHWLHNHSTCPLCRAPVVSSKPRRPPPSSPAAVLQEHHITITEGSSSTSATSYI